MTVPRSPAWVVLASLACLLSGAAPSARADDEVVLQLPYVPQFQYAGYFAARDLGFYRDEGLAVTIREGTKARAADEVVLAGDAHFGVLGSELVLRRLQGLPVVALAVVFQHSPYALLTREGLATPSALADRTLMLELNHRDAEYLAMFQREGIGRERLRLVRNSWDLDDLVAGRADAVGVYLTDQPLELRERGVPFGLVRPANYGIDFYGDCLFTCEREVERDPARVEAFRRASLRGWAWAFDHVDEAAALLLRAGAAAQGKTAQRLRAEGRAMEELVLPRLVQLGHMNPGRWERMADTFVSLGLAPDGPTAPRLAGFTWSGAAAQASGGRWAVAGAAVAVAAAIAAWNLRLRRTVQARTAELAARTAALAEETAQRHRDTEALLRAAEHLPVMLDAYDEPGRIVVWNRECERVTGWSAAEIVGRDDALERLVPDREYRERMLAEWRAKATYRHWEWELRAKDGRRLVIAWSLVAPTLPLPGIATWGLGVDVTDRVLTAEALRRSEEALRQAQKLDSIGRLAGGVAHDFNNILTSLLGGCELAALEAPADSRLREHIDMLRLAANRGVALTAQLLGFARRSAHEPQVLELGSFLEQTRGLLTRLLREDIELTVVTTGEAPLVRADPGHLTQVLMNLSANARDAMPAGGSLRIEVDGVDLRPEEVAAGGAYAASGLVAGRHARLRVRDSGTGLDPGVRERLFEPFVTTKEPGRGTGLGLATCWGVLKQNQGHIEVEASDSGGTTFCLLLPATTLAPGEAPAAPAPARPADAPRSGGTEAILVVEDDPHVRLLIQMDLSGRGYRISTAADGQEAMRLLETAGPFDLLVSDLVMPRVGGRTLAEQARDQEVKVVLMSGHPPAPGGELPHLRKPFLPDDLAGLVRATLDAPAR